MSIVKRLVFVVCLCMVGLFVHTVHVHALYNDIEVCMQQSMCEYQAEIVQRIDDATARALFISDEEVKMNIFASLEQVRALASDRYLGKSLMLLIATSRTVYRELTYPVSSIPLTSMAPIIDATTTDTVVIDEATTSTAFIMNAPTTHIETSNKTSTSSIDIDKDAIILSE